MTSTSPARRLLQKLVRYALVSAIAVVFGQILLLFFNAGLEWAATTANVAAVCISAVPSYVLNRYWTWEKRGRNHILKEVLPFWLMTLAALGLSTWFVGLAAQRWSNPLAVNAANLLAFGSLWLLKFVAMNSFLFRDRADAVRRPPTFTSTRDTSPDT